MFNLTHHKTTPFGSMLSRSKEEQKRLLEVSFYSPKNIKALLISSGTGAFIRGLAKSYRLSEKDPTKIAFVILRIVLAEKTLAQLPSMLSTELKLPNDQAQKMAQEIEEDLFKPVIKELEEFWDKQKKEEPVKEAEIRANQEGAKNILNLKKEQKPPTPPWREQN